MKAFATRALARRPSLSSGLGHEGSASPRNKFSPMTQVPLRLIDERGAVVDSPAFREQLRNANDWSFGASLKIKNAAKHLQDVAALEAQLATAKKSAYTALHDIAKQLSNDGYSDEVKTLALDSVQLLLQLSETESSRLTLVCSYLRDNFVCVLCGSSSSPTLPFFFCVFFSPFAVQEN